MAKPPKTTTGKRSKASTAPAKRSLQRNTVWTIGAVVLAAGAGLAAFFTRGRIAAAAASTAGGEGHIPTDLLDPNRNADDRAVADFRPDMDAVMTSAEREALRPATGNGLSLTAAAGSIAAETA